MTQPTSPDAARHSVAQDRWRRAYAEFAEADESSLGAAELEAFADTAWWTCHADQAIELRQRAVHRYLDEGNPVGAARVALNLSWDHSARGAYAVSRGWVGRAERLLTPFPDAPERALLALTQAVTALDIGEVDAGLPPAGDLDTAREALAELDRIVGDYRIADRPAPAFEAAAHLAHGQFALADGQVAEAARSLRQAREGWRAIGAPYETAHARLLLGLAYRRSGDEDGAMGELEAALAVFERLGARLDEERAKELLGRLERRRTFMFTDIVGSTQLVETLGDEKWRRLLARHDTLLREQITAAGGEVIKQTGDGFFAAFDRPKEAIGAAVAIQRALADEVVAPDVRIGVHTGGAFHTEGEASDYGGQGVHMAARIGAAAGAGEILVSRDSVDGSGGAFTFTEPREIGVKGFSAPVVVTTVRWR
jgi:class 3 adenylate cyclase